MLRYWVFIVGGKKNDNDSYRRLIMLIWRRWYRPANIIRRPYQVPDYRKPCRCVKIKHTPTMKHLESSTTWPSSGGHGGYPWCPLQLGSCTGQRSRCRMTVQTSSQRRLMTSFTSHCPHAPTPTDLDSCRHHKFPGNHTSAAYVTADQELWWRRAVRTLWMKTHKKKEKKTLFISF